MEKIWSTMQVSPPQICLPFVQEPSLDGEGTGTKTLFGKNSDRPSEENATRLSAFHDYGARNRKLCNVSKLAFLKHQKC